MRSRAPSSELSTQEAEEKGARVEAVRGPGGGEGSLPIAERQVAKALQLGAERAEEAGFQYIVTMNSDALPREGFRRGFDIQRYVMDTKLTDATDTGGLFGLPFN